MWRSWEFLKEKREERKRGFGVQKKRGRAVTKKKEEEGILDEPVDPLYK